MDLNRLLKKLAHKFPMLMLDEVLEADDKMALTRSIIKTSNPFIKKDNTLSEFAFIELMAQTVAVQVGFVYDSSDQKAPSVGFLLGLKPFECHSQLSLNDEVVVTAFLEHSLDNFKIFRCTVKKEEKVIAMGVLKIYEQH